MKKEDIKRFQFRQPFSPFELKLSDGRSFTIEHPEFLMHSPRANSVLLANEEDDRWILIDLRHILSVTSDEPPRDEAAKDKLGLDDV